MLSAIHEALGQAGPTIIVGQDCAGHWLVQDSAQRLEGRFVSFAAAMRYAQGERQMYHAEIAISSIPLVPLIPFGPIAPEERALPHAA